MYLVDEVEAGIQHPVPDTVRETVIYNSPLYLNSVRLTSPLLSLQVVVTSRDIISASKIFGFNEQGGTGGGESSECTVCLTEPKDTVLLPCRHLCVCHTCFTHIDKCPVCRSLFERHVVFDGEAAPETETENLSSSTEPSFEPALGQTDEEEEERERSVVSSDDGNVLNPLHV